MNARIGLNIPWGPAYAIGAAAAAVYVAAIVRYGKKRARVTTK